MRNFLRIAENIDVLPVLHEIAARPHLWNRHTVRTFHEQSAHRSLDDIVLRYNPFDGAKDDFVDAVCSRIHVVNYPAMAELPLARQIVMALMGRVQGEHLGRAFISRIKPGGSIPPHTDRIPPAEEAFPDRIPPASYYDRYHVVLQSQPGTVFACGDEQVYMPPGTVWWFNNQLEHSVVNNSADDRIHLIVDIAHSHFDYLPPAAAAGAAP